MKLHRLDHICINVHDLPAAKKFFIALGMQAMGAAKLKGEWLDKLTALKDVKTELVMMRTPDGGANIELVKFHSPSDKKGVKKSFSNTLGMRHIAFAVQDIEALVAKLKKQGAEPLSDIYNYQNVYKLCYLRGPEGIILELAEEIK